MSSGHSAGASNSGHLPGRGDGVDVANLFLNFSQTGTTGTAEGEGLVGPRPHHFFAPPFPLFALKRKIIKIKKKT